MFAEKSVSVGINGYLGEVGRSAVRYLTSPGLEGYKPLTLRAVNNRSRPEDSSLIQYESDITQYYPGYEIGEDNLMTPNGVIQTAYVGTPEELNKAFEGVDILLEASGAYKKRKEMGILLEQFPRIILTTPYGEKDIDVQKYPSIVKGANDEMFHPEEHKAVSAASCTTAAAALTLAMLGYTGRILEKEVVDVSLVTVHAFTPSQNISQGTHKKGGGLMEGQNNNIILSTTGAKESLSQIYPSLKGKVKVADSIRIPVSRGSYIIMHINLEDPVTLEEVLEKAQERVWSGMFADTAMIAASEPNLNTSKKVMANPDFRNKAAILLSDKIKIMNGGHEIKVEAWYNNVDGYVNAALRLAQFVAKTGR